MTEKKIKTQDDIFNTIIRKIAYLITIGFMGGCFKFSEILSMLNVEFVNDIIHYAVLLFWLFVFVLRIFRLRHVDLKLIASIIVLTVIWVIVTIMAGGNYISIIFKMIGIISNIAFLYVVTNARKKEFLEVFTYYTYFFVMANLIYLLFFVDLSTYRNASFCLLGSRNQIAIDLVLGLAINRVYYENTGKKKFYYTYVAMIIATALLCQSATTSIGVFVGTILILFGCNDKVYLKLKPVRVVGGYLLIWGLLIFIQSIGLTQFIATLLNRDFTFSGRTAIWDLTLVKIAENKMWGIGWHGNNELGLMLHTGLYSTHNELLQLIYESGLVFTVIFVCLIYWIMKQKYENNRNRAFYYVFIVVFVVWLTESTGVNQILILFPMWIYLSEDENI